MKNVDQYIFGKGSSHQLKAVLNKRRLQLDGPVIFLVDAFFKSLELEFLNDAFESGDRIIYVTTEIEPTVEYVDGIVESLNNLERKPVAIVSIGGGITLDCGKALSNLLTNPGSASVYQGWDLVRNAGVYKLAIPTISGTGAEATRTCVVTNKATGVKLGMNSSYSVYDAIIMDPLLTASVPREQYFYTGMDAYIHCIESLEGSYRNRVGDAFSRECLALCREVFFSDDMLSDENRERLMVASYLGGCAIASSFVGLVHPLSAGLSVVLGVHHCEANCIVMNSPAMAQFYPHAHSEFRKMMRKQDVTVKEGICHSLSTKQMTDLYDSMIVHEKPLRNALGVNFNQILTREFVANVYQTM